MADLGSWPPAAVITTARLDLEPLRIDHAAEMATALDNPALDTHTGGRPASAEQLAARCARQVVGASPDSVQRWCNWVLRQRSDASAAGYVQATIEA